MPLRIGLRCSGLDVSRCLCVLSPILQYLPSITYLSVSTWVRVMGMHCLSKEIPPSFPRNPLQLSIFADSSRLMSYACLPEYTLFIIERVNPDLFGLGGSLPSSIGIPLNRKMVPIIVCKFNIAVFHPIFTS